MYGIQIKITWHLARCQFFFTLFIIMWIYLRKRQSEWSELSTIRCVPFRLYCLKSEAKGLERIN